MTVSLRGGPEWEGAPQPLYNLEYNLFTLVRQFLGLDIDLPTIDYSNERRNPILNILLLSCQAGMLTVDYFKSSVSGH